MKLEFTALDMEMLDCFPLPVVDETVLSSARKVNTPGLSPRTADCVS